jgi:flavodoxin
MEALVIYDSKHGNTAQIAQTIGDAISAPVLRPDQVDPADLREVDLLIVGSPTHGGWPTEAIQGLLKASPALGGLAVAAFDTRTATIWNRILPFGYAAPRIAKSLGASGGNLLAPPEGFIVLGMEGPLKDGELERAAAWARQIAA